MITLKTDPWAHELRATQILRYRILGNMINKDLNLCDEKKIYDCACSNNYFLGLLQNDVNFSIYGSDINENAIQDAQAKYPTSEFAVSQLPSVPDFGHSYDAIFALEVLYYLDEPDYLQSLHNLMKHLKSTGVLYISNPKESYQHVDHDKLISTVHDHHAVTVEVRHLNLSGAINLEKVLLRVLKICCSLNLLKIEPDSGILQTQRSINPKFSRLVSFLLRPAIPTILKFMLNETIMATANHILNAVMRLEHSHTLYVIRPK